MDSALPGSCINRLALVQGVISLCCLSASQLSLLVQVKVPIVGEPAAPGTNKTILTRAPVDSVTAPGFSGEGEACRTVIVRTEGPVPAKVSF